MMTEGKQRFQAISASHAGMMDRATRYPEKVIQGMFDYPDLLDLSPRILHDIFDILLEKGYEDRLLMLADVSRVPFLTRAIIVQKCLLTYDGNPKSLPDMVKKMSKWPEFLGNALKALEEVVDVMVKNGQIDSLLRLCDSRSLSPKARSIIVNKCLFK